ncbi:hypothetical protein E2C01_027584 [Portunus trituberculatus]|uniref:Uncharacterized protein n=1 Tax=Portunus trituberculatus TaxID=210409 RepID=A0A5B7EMD1_PORTR|nr:hypothetical protein [Portunus trituberculatus]
MEGVAAARGDNSSRRYPGYSAMCTPRNPTAAALSLPTDERQRGVQRAAQPRVRYSYAPRRLATTVMTRGDRDRGGGWRLGGSSARQGKVKVKGAR